MAAGWGEMSPFLWVKKKQEKMSSPKESVYDNIHFSAFFSLITSKCCGHIFPLFFPI